MKIMSAHTDMSIDTTINQIHRQRTDGNNNNLRTSQVVSFFILQSTKKEMGRESKRKPRNSTIER